MFPSYLNSKVEFEQGGLVVHFVLTATHPKEEAESWVILSPSVPWGSTEVLKEAWNGCSARFI